MDSEFWGKSLAGKQLNLLDSGGYVAGTGEGCPHQDVCPRVIRMIDHARDVIGVQIDQLHDLCQLGGVFPEGLLFLEQRT